MPRPSKSGGGLPEDGEDGRGDQIHREPSIKPEFPDACNNLGLSLYGLHRYPEAVKAFQEAIRQSQKKESIITISASLKPPSAIIGLASILPGGGPDQPRPCQGPL